MFKILKADSDCYINNRIINGRSCENSNCGQAGTLDLYKIYGINPDNPNPELSRVLIHFDLSSLKMAWESSSIDLEDPSFFAKMILSDVYGGQPTPENFSLRLNPLSASFLEGLGRDIVEYGDFDVSNFLTSSRTNNGEPIPWILPGCHGSGSVDELCDFFTGSFEKTIDFKSGEEDFQVDVTDIVKMILRSEIPDSGFRISFSERHENDNRTYFVKRFASRHAFDESKRPKLIWGFDDSIKDTSEFLYADVESTFVLYNVEGGVLKNLVFEENQVSGDNCLLLKLSIPPSGTYFFTGSQFKSGLSQSTGIYVASGTIPRDERFVLAQNISGSQRVQIGCEWISNDESKIFAKLKNRYIFEKQVFDTNLSSKKFTVSTTVESSYGPNETSIIRVNVFDPDSPAIIASRVGVPSPSGYQGIIEDACYAVRDIVTEETVIPFDFDKHSTRISSDASGMFFKLDMSNLIPGRSYVIDVALKIASMKNVYSSTSPIFKINMR